MAHSLYGEEFRGMRQARAKAGQRIRRCRKNCYHSSGSIRSARSRVYGCTEQLLHQYWEILGPYFGNFIPGMVLEIWLMIPARSRGRRGCCARSSSHSDKSLAANLWPSDLLWLFFFSYSWLSIKIFKDKNPRTKNSWSSNDISRKTFRYKARGSCLEATHTTYSI